MVAGSITEEVTLAVPAERMWKVAFAATNTVLLPKACAGYVDSVEVEGDGASPGSVTTMKLNPSLGDIPPLKSRVVTFDDAARVTKKEVLEGGTLSAQLKTHIVEYRLEDAGEGASVFKVKVDYERIDGAALAPEDEAKLMQGNISLIKVAEAYLIAHPDEAT